MANRRGESPGMARAGLRLPGEPSRGKSPKRRLPLESPEKGPPPPSREGVFASLPSLDSSLSQVHHSHSSLNSSFLKLRAHSCDCTALSGDSTALSGNFSAHSRRSTAPSANFSVNTAEFSPRYQDPEGR